MIHIDEPVEKGVILRREYKETAENWWQEVATNVPHNIVYHSPTGFEWGYGGSGPSELALNLAELVIQKAGLATEQGTHCSELAWELKHHVKQLLIVNLPEEGAYIPWKLVCYTVFDALPTQGENCLLNRQHLIDYIGGL